jgi:hypothetical protein
MVNFIQTDVVDWHHWFQAELPPVAVALHSVFTGVLA